MDATRILRADKPFRGEQIVEALRRALQLEAA